LPKVDPEAHKPDMPVKSIPLHEISPSPGVPEKREFHLANGERVAGIVLSETPEAVYIDHGTLGVLTIPRANIAKRLVEIILINGDRIVGDIMAETADTLYVRHASLGMLTVPRAQRSTRVVEAILKDGDRILGEVLTETDSFTVIRSATLGTITVPHDKVTMLNRKIEQIELKALPPPAPEIKDKPSG
jgi:RNase P/RNase MRP subunit p29